MVDISNDKWVIDAICNGIRWNNAMLDQLINCPVPRPVNEIIIGYAIDDPCFARTVFTFEGKLDACVVTSIHTREARLKARRHRNEDGYTFYIESVIRTATGVPWSAKTCLTYSIKADELYHLLTGDHGDLAANLVQGEIDGIEFADADEEDAAFEPFIESLWLAILEFGQQLQARTVCAASGRRVRKT